MNNMITNDVIYGIQENIKKFDREDYPAVLVAVTPMNNQKGEADNYLVVVRRVLVVSGNIEFEYVRWWWNVGGLFWGHYYGTLEAAMQNFAETVSKSFS